MRPSAREIHKVVELEEQLALRRVREVRAAEPHRLALRPSMVPGAGLGLFARTDIKENTRIAEYRGASYLREDFDQATGAAEGQGVLTTWKAWAFVGKDGLERVIDPDAWRYDVAQKEWKDRVVPGAFANDLFPGTPLYAAGIRVAPLWCAQQGIASPYQVRDGVQVDACSDLRTNAFAQITAYRSRATGEWVHHLFLVAQEDIRAGQEIFVSYGEDYWIGGFTKLVHARFVEVLDALGAHGRTEAVTFNQVLDVMYPELLQLWNTARMRNCSPSDNWRRNFMRLARAAGTVLPRRRREEGKRPANGNRKEALEMNGYRLHSTKVREEGGVLDVLRPLLFLEQFFQTGRAGVARDEANAVHRRRFGSGQVSGKEVTGFYLSETGAHEPWRNVTPLGPPREPTAWGREEWKQARTAYRAYFKVESKDLGRAPDVITCATDFHDLRERVQAAVMRSAQRTLSLRRVANLGGLPRNAPRRPRFVGVLPSPAALEEYPE